VLQRPHQHLSPPPFPHTATRSTPDPHSQIHLQPLQLPQDPLDIPPFLHIRLDHHHLPRFACLLVRSQTKLFYALELVRAAGDEDDVRPGFGEEEGGGGADAGAGAGDEG
jgi:hypothetical protein